MEAPHKKKMRSPLSSRRSAKAAKEQRSLPPDDASPQQNGVDATKQKPLSSIELKYLDYLKRELKVDVNGCAIGYFLDKNFIGSGGSASSRCRGRSPPGARRSWS